MKYILIQIVKVLPYRARGWIKYIPGIKQLQQSIMEAYLDGSSFQHKIRGGPADGLIYPVELPIDKGIWLGNYEQSFSECLAREVRPGMVCYDIGGFRGFFTGVMACQGAREVHVFEPLPNNLEQIDRLVGLNPKLDLRVHRFALGDDNGEVSFQIMPEASMGKLEASVFQSNDSPLENVDITIRSIDALLADDEFNAPDLLKIDVEGAEASVLRGMTGLLARSRPIFFIEAHSHDLAQECVSLLEPYNYKFSVLETGKSPDFQAEPEVCHIRASPV